MGHVTAAPRWWVRYNDGGTVESSNRGNASLFHRGRPRIPRRTSRQVLGVRSRAGKYNSGGVEGSKTGTKSSPEERLRLSYKEPEVIRQTRGKTRKNP